jgi:hypothetical protein
VNKLSKFSINHPVIVIIIFLILTIFFALEIPDIEVDSSLKGLIPDNMTSRINLDKIEAIFGGTDAVMIILESDNILNKETLKRAHYFSNELENWEEIDSVNTPFTIQEISGKEGTLNIEDAINQIPETKKELANLEEKIKNNELIYGNIISDDFKAMALVGFLKEDIDDNLILAKVNNLIKTYSGKEKISLAGMPIIRAEVSKNTQNDMRKLMPFALLIMLIFLYLCFRQLRGVILPFLVVLMSIIISMGLIAVLDWKIYLITVILPMSLIAIANDYGIHIIAHYQEEKKIDYRASERSLIKRVISSMGAPIITAGITTIAGMLCLSSHIMIPARELGFLAAAGIAFALLASITFIPAVMVILPAAKKYDSKHKIKESGLEKILNSIAAYVSKSPEIIVIVFSLTIIVVSLGIFNLKVDTNPVNYFKERSEVVKSTEAANNYFGGANTISVMAEGDMTDPMTMKKISDFEQKLKGHKNIGEVNAISKIIRKFNKELHNGEEKYNIIPQNKNALPQYYMLYESSGDLKKLLDFDRKHALLTAKIPTNSTQDIKEIVNYIRQEINSVSDSPLKLVGGFGDLQSELSDAVVKGQLISLLTAVIVVGIIIMILFQSLTAGFLSVIPLIMAILILFSLMGIFNIELNIATALLSSVMVGVGVDYTIHFLWRYREEKKIYNSKIAVKRTIKTTGRGIIFNALSVVVGFSALMFSDFLPVKFFGFLVVVSIAACLLGALIFLPAVCIIFEPKFLESKKESYNCKEFELEEESA